MAVRVIRANNLTASSTMDAGPTKLRVAAYCRVSTDSKEQKSSYEAQCAHYITYIGEHADWTLVGIFADEGISGTQARRRPEFLRMIGACQRHEIDLVITKSISRFARNTLDCLNYIRMLKALGIPVVFEKESINTMEASGEVLITILASIAQQESASISQNVKMGIRYIMRTGRGRVNYTQFLGYTQGPTKGSLVIVPEEAEVVRRIYREYLDGYSPAMIAAHLDAEGVSTPTGGGRWYASTIASILDNEKYCGDLLLQKYYTQDFLTHKIVKNKGQLPQYFVEDHHDPIVPKAIYRQVHGERMRRAALKRQPSMLRFGSSKALNGRLICGKCGNTLKRYIHSDAELNDWRCRPRAQTLKNEAAEYVESRCSLRFLPERVAQDCIVRAFNQLPKEREALERQRDGVLAPELARIDEMLARQDEEQRCLEEQIEMLALEDGMRPEAVLEIPVEGGDVRPEERALWQQIARIREQRDQPYCERAEYAYEEMQIRIALELIDQMDERRRTSMLRNQKEVTPLASRAPDPACREEEDFFTRTRYRVPDELLDNDGHLRAFDDVLLTRYLDHVVVYDDCCEVHLKAGAVLRVLLDVSSGAIGSTLVRDA